MLPWHWCGYFHDDNQQIRSWISSRDYLALFMAIYWILSIAYQYDHRQITPFYFIILQAKPKVEWIEYILSVFVASKLTCLVIYIINFKKSNSKWKTSTWLLTRLHTLLHDITSCISIETSSYLSFVWVGPVFLLWSCSRLFTIVTLSLIGSVLYYCPTRHFTYNLM